MEILSGLAGHPERSAPVIHVAGSKGKGSVTGMISAMLEAAGFFPARYTSPHVSEYRERITAGSRYFDESVYIQAGMELWEIAETVQRGSKKAYALFDTQSERGEAPSFFELLTLYFFLCARAARRDVLVVETGMGGRLDATNIVDPLVSVITAIELEHTQYLGNTIAAIAGEKAGIIKAGRPLVLFEQEAEALNVFQEAALEKGAPLYYFPRLAEIQSLCFDRQGTDFSLVFKDGEGTAPQKETPPFRRLSDTGKIDITLSIPGKIQGKNAGLSILALKAAFPRIGAEAIRSGLRNFRLPARFERIRENPPVIIDGAHTPRSTELCADTFTSLYGEGGILLFGCTAGKDGETMARLLAPHFSRIIVTAPGSFKTSDPEKLFRFFQYEAEKIERPAQPRVSFMKDTEQAVRAALNLGEESGLPLLGTGSFYLAAAIRQEPHCKKS
ncbi:MAG: tetrahydrofolate synthase [Treponema sp.]|nr:tetrahydrofolate synthase [Treponema sp.]